MKFKVLSSRNCAYGLGGYYWYTQSYQSRENVLAPKYICLLLNGLKRVTALPEFENSEHPS